jgi:hypothetical protein
MDDWIEELIIYTGITSISCGISITPN